MIATTRRLFVRLGLRFRDEADERRFVERFTLDDLARTQAAMVLGAIVYTGFMVWDRILDPSAWMTTAAIRSGVALFVLLPLTALLFLKAARPWAEWIFLVYCVVPGCMLSVIYWLLEPGFDQAAAGVIIVILFVSTLLPLRTSSLLTFCILTWTCFVAIESFAVHERAGMRFVNNFEIGISYALALYATAAREYRARRQFLTAQALEQETERSEAALAELRRTQTHLVQSEKLAALGQLVAGVAHEVNTPIGLALTTSTAFEAEVKRLDRHIASGQVRRSELTESIARLTEGSRLVFSNLNRAADLVQNFKKVATDQANEERRAFELRPWLLELLSTLEPLLRRKGHEVRLTCPDDIAMNTYPGPLAQVISNLALNAVIHGYPDGVRGVIRLDIAPVSETELRIDLADDGAGIAPENLAKVFDPFFTTRRDRGSTGLGLHIVYNLVVSTLGGRIAVESRVGGGTRFTVHLPTSHQSEGASGA